MFQAIGKKHVSETHGNPLLEAQIATGGLYSIDPAAFFCELHSALGCGCGVFCHLDCIAELGRLRVTIYLPVA